MNNKLRIGIDFDNTIVNYDNLFHQALSERDWKDISFLGTSKLSIKANLFRCDGNDLRWQELQAIVYGILIKNAPPFPGLIDTLSFLKSTNDFELFIVSHKSKYSSHLKNITLIDKALLWIQENKISDFIPMDNIFFVPTRDEKIQTIKNLSINLFIDDLIEVLEDDNFPPIIKILFSSEFLECRDNSIVRLDNWNDIKKKLLQSNG